MADIVERKGRDGSVSYYVRIRRRGAKAACATFTRKTEAKLWIAETERAVLEGKYFERAEEKKHTLDEAVERFNRDYPCSQIRKNQLALWCKEIGFKKLFDVTPPIVNEIMMKWKREPNARQEIRGPAIINRYLSTLSVVLTAATRDWGWLSHNPLRDVRRLREPRGRVRYLSEEERARLLTACATSYCPYVELVVVLALSTGMRKSEIMTLTWKDIDLEHGIIVLQKTKNGDRRRVAARGKALELLRHHSKVKRLKTDLVFPGELSGLNGKPFDIRKSWQDARRRANIENFVFHDLRHSCASYLAMGGASALEIAEVLGHKTLEMVRRYSHLSESHVAGVVEIMNKRIFG